MNRDFSFAGEYFVFCGCKIDLCLCQVHENQSNAVPEKQMKALIGKYPPEDGNVNIKACNEDSINLALIHG